MQPRRHHSLTCDMCPHAGSLDVHALILLASHERHVRENLFGFEHTHRAGAVLRKNPKDLPQMFETMKVASTTKLRVTQGILMVNARNCAKSSFQLASIPLAKQRLLAPGRSGSAALRLRHGGEDLAGWVCMGL